MSISKHDLNRFAKLIEMIIDNNPIAPNPKKLPGSWLVEQWKIRKYPDDAFGHKFAADVYGEEFNYSDIDLNNCPECDIRDYRRHHCEDTIQNEIDICYAIFKRYMNATERDFIKKKSKVDKNPTLLKKYIVEYAKHVRAEEGIDFLPQGLENYSSKQGLDDNEFILAYISDLCKNDQSSQ